MFNNDTIDYYDLPIFVTTIALVIGIGFASVLSKDFNLDLGTKKEFLIKIVAGILMGFSVGLILGGNDSLIFYGIPGIAIHAPIALIMMMVAIALTFSVKKRFKAS